VDAEKKGGPAAVVFPFEVGRKKADVKAKTPLQYHIGVYGIHLAPAAVK